MAAEASFAERQAMEVEREVMDVYRAFFLRDRVGDVLDGVISGVTGFGVFVVVDEPFVEGLVRIDALSDDYYNFDEPACRLVGRRSGRTFSLGDAVKVEVQSVSVVRRTIDFALAEHAARQRARVGREPDRGKRRRDSHPGRGRDRDQRKAEGQGQGQGGDRSRRGDRRAAGKPSGGNRHPGKPKKKRR
jgi:ribonuclease R